MPIIYDRWKDVFADETLVLVFVMGFVCRGMRCWLSVSCCMFVIELFRFVNC